MARNRETLTTSADVWVRWFRAAAVGLIALLLYFFPLFHVLPLARANPNQAVAFSATSFAERFWSETMLKSLDRAVPAETLLAAIQNDPTAAHKKYGRTLGLNESYTYFVSGTGRIMAITDEGISLAVTPGSNQPEILLQTGLIFGNAVRDGTGLLEVNQFSNSQEFNDLSAALNHLVETRVLPMLKAQVKVGGQIRFTGCAAVEDEATDLKPLQLVPVAVEFP